MTRALIIIGALWVLIIGLHVARSLRESPPFQEWNREMRIAVGAELPIWLWWVMTVMAAIVLASWYAPKRLIRNAWDVVRVHYFAWRLKRLLQRLNPGAKITSEVYVVIDRSASTTPKITLPEFPK